MMGGWGFPPVFVPQWKIWTKYGWFVYQELDAKKGPKLIDMGIHELGVVPLVPFYGIKYSDCIGLPAAYGVLDHIISLYNKESLADRYEEVSCHPIPYTIGPKPPAKIDTGKGIHLPTIPDHPIPHIGFLEPNGSSLQIIRDSRIDLRYRIISIALGRARKETAQVQSGESIKQDRKIFSGELVNASIGYEQSEKRCWQIFALWLELVKSIDEADSLIRISYNRDFEDEMFDPSLITTLRELVLGEMLPLRTFLELLVSGEILPAGTNVEELLEVLHKEMAEREYGVFQHKGTEIGAAEG